MAMPQAARSKMPPHLFTVEEYHRMREAGILGEDDRVELLEGEVVEMAPIGSRHAHVVSVLTELLTQRARQRAVVWPQNPVRLGPRSEPQPDVALLVRRPGGYAAALPTAEDVLLVIEVADASADHDRQVKAPLYARARVRECWIVDLAAEQVEVHRAPTARGYRELRKLGRGEAISPLAFPDIELSVDEVLG